MKNCFSKCKTREPAPTMCITNLQQMFQNLLLLFSVYAPTARNNDELRIQLFPIAYTSVFQLVTITLKTSYCWIHSSPTGLRKSKLPKKLSSEIKSLSGASEIVKKSQGNVPRTNYTIATLDKPQHLNKKDQTSF